MAQNKADVTKTEAVKASTIDEYMKDFSQEQQQSMEQIRRVIRDAAPEAQEKISWGMPTFYWKGNLVHFAAHKKHLGFYPGAQPIVEFAERLTEFKTSKGAVQFPYTDNLPEQLITDMVKCAIEVNQAHFLAKAQKNQK
ncbi:MAG: iron chaperone [Lachnospiraceae bacterium]